jgi:hypothetical protein
LKVNTLFFRFTFRAQPFFAPFLHCCQNIRLVPRVFQLHPFEKHLEFHRSHWLQGILHFPNELGIVHPAVAQLSPGGLCEPASRLDRRPELGGYQGFQGDCRSEIRLPLILLEQGVNATKSGIGEAPFGCLANVPVRQRQAREHHGV